MVTPAAAAPPTGTEGMRRRSADGTPGGGSPPAEQDLDYSTDEDLSCRTCCLIAGRRRRVGACELVCCCPLNVIKIITSKKSLVISFVVHSWFCQSELRFCQIYPVHNWGDRFR